MPDEATTTAISYGASVLGGGGVTAFVVKLIFGGISRRLDKIEETLERLVAKQDERHEKMIRELGRVEDKANAAFAKYDPLKAAVDEVKASLKDLEHDLRSRRRK